MAAAATTRDFAGLVFQTVSSDSLTAEQRTQMFGLFDTCYRQANHDHLEKSLTRLRYVSFAWHDEQPVGFGLADCLIIELPRLPQQTVVLGGLCCVSPQFRRRGLFRELELRAVMAGDPPRAGPHLSCGRVAHPAAFRTLRANATVVPQPGIPPTPWQQDVGQAIADVYGVETFDRETFVCVGRGRPIGYPVIDVEVDPEEWEVFRQVDRDRGDALLGIAWMPDAPPGWDAAGA